MDHIVIEGKLNIFKWMKPVIKAAIHSLLLLLKRPNIIWIADVEMSHTYMVCKGGRTIEGEQDVPL